MTATIDPSSLSVALLAGGASGEREISLASGAGACEALKEAGFKLIRMPVSWHNHLTDDDYTIDETWMNRVREVAGWIVDEGMYVIINIHHDNSELFLYPDSEHYEQSEKYVTSIWKQVSEAFADFDEHCIHERTAAGRPAV